MVIMLKAVLNTPVLNNSQCDGKKSIAEPHC
nr:MAG TPA: hypothetical protein [Caudoviricetes sp.]DAV93002.1 MAG TPA: hypothetical protein [Bacteriophage sp.]